jgi:hypothetical protein
MQSLNVCGFEVVGGVDRVGVVFLNLTPALKSLISRTSKSVKGDSATRLPVQGNYYEGELKPSLISGSRAEKIRYQDSYDVRLLISSQSVLVEVVLGDTRLASKKLPVRNFNAQSFSLVQVD